MNRSETIALRPGFVLARICKGNWQIAVDHSGATIDLQAVVGDMFAFVDAGITTFVCGDIYVGVGERIGAFIERYRQRHGAGAAARIKVLTTYVRGFLDEQGLRDFSRGDCEAVIDRSLRRLRRERLDLVQMHWWHYAIPGHVEMALALHELQRKGKIDRIGATNFDVPHMREFFEAGVDVVAHTVQYSVIDRRPEHGMVELCAKHGRHLLAYGAVGGLISEKWLGVEDPGAPAPENVSLDKYYRIVLDLGGWALFQRLLRVLDAIARKPGASIANVACRYVLERPQVGSVIIGARHTRHLRVFSCALDAQDRAAIADVHSASTGPAGDCYELDRNEDRDALEEVKTEYHDVENGKLVRRTRPPVSVAEPYGHYLNRS